MGTREKPEAPNHRPVLLWWELLSYTLLLATAFVFSAPRSSEWVAVPLVLAVLVVRGVRVLLERRAM